MKDNENEKKKDSENRYFVGQNLGNLMHEVTQMVLEMLEDSKSSDENRIKIIPSNPKPFKLWWEFYLDDNCVCKICIEAEDIYHAEETVCWLEWYDESIGDFLEYYISQFGFPEWVATEEDEDLFFDRACDKKK